MWCDDNDKTKAWLGVLLRKEKEGYFQAEHERVIVRNKLAKRREASGL